MAILMRIIMWALAACVGLSMASSIGTATEVASSTFSPFGFLAAGILVAAIGYAIAQLKRR